MTTVDFAEVERLQHERNWPQLGLILPEAARQLERGGADLIILCTNTMHKESDAIERAVRTRSLHIVDATAVAI
jgi:aspartate racemase